MGAPGIEPSALAEALSGEHTRVSADDGGGDGGPRRVRAAMLFIAGQEEAEEVVAQLPTGNGYVCLDTTNLPNTMREIFTAANQA